MSITQEAGRGGGTLDRAAALDELDVLATVEHALVVEYQRVRCALGMDLRAEKGGPVTKAAGVVNEASVAAMRRLRRINEVLVAAGRPPQADRAMRLDSEIQFGPLSREQLEAVVEREETIAAAADERFARLLPTVQPPTAVFGEDLLGLVTNVIESGREHGAALVDLGTNLRGVPPSEYLQATRREPADALERDVLELSDQCYQIVVEAVRASFAYDEQLGGQLLQQAMSGMFTLEEINRLLVARGLLPAFGQP